MVTIKKAAELVGLSAKAIRYYESVGLCAPSARSDSGHRLYSPETICRLRQIKYLRTLKFSIRDIAELLDAPQEEMRAAMQRQLDYVEMQLTEYRRAQMGLNAALSTEQNAMMTDPPRLAVVAIDLQNDILPGGALSCKRILNILPRLKELFSRARSLGVPVIYICDCHKEDDEELLIWNDHMIEGSYGSQIIEEVAPLSCDYVVQKNRFNGFIHTDLQSLLDMLKIRTLLFVGWRTDVCVAQTAIEAFYRGYHVAIASDGTDSTSQKEHEYGLSLMQVNYGFELYPCSQALDALLEK